MRPMLSEGRAPCVSLRGARSSLSICALARVTAVTFVFTALMVSSVSVAAKAETEASDETALRAEYGVTLALSGKADEAERVFTAILSEDPQNAGTLNNLGNLYLVRGNVEVALAFYRTASQADSSDAGIVLNRSIALMLLGDDAAAIREAARAQEMAGGTQTARSILGLPGGEGDAGGDKAADETFLTQEEISALLEAAVASVPIDTLATAEGDSTGAPPETSTQPVRPRNWRSAGPRASGGGETSPMLYWKR
jgi:tetratricopeptide (TPR) repeat protein